MTGMLIDAGKIGVLRLKPVFHNELSKKPQIPRIKLDAKKAALLHPYFDLVLLKPSFLANSMNNPSGS